MPAVFALACGRQDAEPRASNPKGPAGVEAKQPTSVTSPPSIDSALVARARALVADARPSFREWREDQYAPLAPVDATPVPRWGPIVGDFDGDGQPDVVFDGWDPHGELVPVVLSNKGKPIVANVTEGPEVTTPPVLRLEHLSVTTVEWKGKPRQALDFIRWARDGRSIESHAPYIWVNGHFSHLIDGE